MYFNRTILWEIDTKSQNWIAAIIIHHIKSEIVEIVPKIIIVHSQEQNYWTLINKIKSIT